MFVKGKLAAAEAPWRGQQLGAVCADDMPAAAAGPSLKWESGWQDSMARCSHHCASQEM